ncbi:MAG: hypothetical protein CMH12_03335 [Maritimibacter sp.]|nr:hypothetical protein [Maritimibacter sp.]
MTLSCDLSVRLKASQRGSSDFGGDRFTPTVAAAIQLASGTGAGQADILFVDERTVSASSNDDLDLSGVLADAFGATIAAAEIVAILVINGPISGEPNLSDLTIGGASNAFEGFLGGTSPTVGPIKPGGVFLLAAGDAAGIGTVGAGSTDELRISAGAGGDATYQIAIIARSA